MGGQLAHVDAHADALALLQVAAFFDVDGALVGAIGAVSLGNLARAQFCGADEPFEELGGEPGVGFADPFRRGNQADDPEYRGGDEGIEHHGDGLLLVVGVAALHDLLGEFDEAVVAWFTGFAADRLGHFVGEEADEEAIDPVVLIFGGWDFGREHFWGVGVLSSILKGMEGDWFRIGGWFLWMGYADSVTEFYGE